MYTYILLVFGASLIFCSSPLVAAACLGLKIPSDVHLLTPLRSFYQTGATFDIVCVPGYGNDTIVQLRCDISGEWHGHWPDCSKKEEKARWWMFLLGMVALVVLVPCILPRLYFTYIDTSSPRKDWLINKRRKSSKKMSDTIRMPNISSQPAHRSTATESRNPQGMYPMPLPPIRRHREHSVNYNEHAAK
ncbi:hypothetical protein EGW08_003119 [Elysia chlorotica]|uniref:Sushi domain-containing protein n=1 Tax=Elysia chlorotica TaxID=188477 RepID=A0A3S1BQK0_ELYCH|nr:hypothetical protein EGW08_003119 [Elysia chlorotica]